MNEPTNESRADAAWSGLKTLLLMSAVLLTGCATADRVAATVMEWAPPPIGTSGDLGIGGGSCDYHDEEAAQVTRQLRSIEWDLDRIATHQQIYGN